MRYKTPARRYGEGLRGITADFLHEENVHQALQRLRMEEGAENSGMPVATPQGNKAIAFA